jgi:DNA-binding transcriptional regulator YhcF (GntR family)
MLSRRFGAQSLVRLLGHWQESTSRTPIWRQLAEALRLLILDGRLALETRLPGERELAAALNISRTTVASALGQLREEGYLYSRQGSGSRIALPERPVEAAAKQTDPLSVNLAVAALSAGPEIHQAYSQALRSCLNIYPTPVTINKGSRFCAKRSPAAIANAGCQPAAMK